MGISRTGFALYILFPWLLLWPFAARAEAPLSRHDIAVVKGGPLPDAVKRFVQALDKQRGKKKLAGRLKEMLASPIKVKETSYEMLGPGCKRHSRERELKETAELLPVLRSLAEAFHVLPVHELHPGVYGVATEDACSHVSSIAMDDKGAKVSEIAADGPPR
jgi:hypothetical protein